MIKENLAQFEFNSNNLKTDTNDINNMKNKIVEILNFHKSKLNNVARPIQKSKRIKIEIEKPI